MKALRITLIQTSASYRRAETIGNKMTYPLPPTSTIFGALRSICPDFHPATAFISVQGDYESMQREFFLSTCTFNCAVDDRGTLIKMANLGLSNSYTKIAKTLITRGDSSFRKNKGIAIFRHDLLEQYCLLYKAVKDKKAEMKILKFSLNY